MDKEEKRKLQQELKICQQKCNPPRPISIFGISVFKSTRDRSTRALMSDVREPRRLPFFNRLEKRNSLLLCSWGLPEDGELGMKGFVDVKRGRVEGFDVESVDEELRGRSSSSETSISEPTTNDEIFPSSSESSPRPPRSASMLLRTRKCMISHKKDETEKGFFESGRNAKQSLEISEIETMKERFAKLLLGEDMSGSGKGVCTALAISNAITNLCATLFGDLWRLQPLPAEKKSMWQREMKLLLSVSDHIVELIPSWQTHPDGRRVEVMTCRPRSDLFINLPALCKLDDMLLGVLDSFSTSQFWYADEGILASEFDGSTSFRGTAPHPEKWWLPVPNVPSGGFDKKTRKHLQSKRECANQIIKAAMAINSNTLAEMEVPESYLEALPKFGKASLGDVTHRYITSDHFNPDYFLDCVDFSNEHQALELANRVEASIYVWRRRTNSKSSWDMVKDFVIDSDKRELLADRAESLLLCLRQRFPTLAQTTLDISKIQCNKDVGKSILEAYSRVLESIAYNIIARIDDLLYADDLAKQSGQLLPPHTVIPKKRVPLSSAAVPASGTPRKGGTPYRTASTTPSISPVPLFSPAIGEKLPLINGKPCARGFSVKKVLTDYLGAEGKGKSTGNTCRQSDAPALRG